MQIQPVKAELGTGTASFGHLERRGLNRLTTMIAQCQQNMANSEAYRMYRQALDVYKLSWRAAWCLATKRGCTQDVSTMTWDDVHLVVQSVQTRAATVIKQANAEDTLQPMARRWIIAKATLLSAVAVSTSGALSSAAVLAQPKTWYSRLSSSAVRLWTWFRTGFNKQGPTPSQLQQQQQETQRYQDGLRQFHEAKQKELDDMPACDSK